MALDRYGQQVANHMKVWMTQRHEDEQATIPDLVNETDEAVNAGWMPWDPAWQEIRNNPPVPEEPTPEPPSEPE
jgi:hypothetical protein